MVEGEVVPWDGILVEEHLWKRYEGLVLEARAIIEAGD